MEREKIHDRSFLDSLDIYGAFIKKYMVGIICTPMKMCI